MSAIVATRLWSDSSGYRLNEMSVLFHEAVASVVLDVTPFVVNTDPHFAAYVVLDLAERTVGFNAVV